MDIDTVDAYTDRLVLTKYGLLGYDLLDRREGEDVTASSRDGGSQCLVCLYQSSIIHGQLEWICALLESHLSDGLAAAFREVRASLVVPAMHQDIG